MADDFIRALQERGDFKLAAELSTITNRPQLAMESYEQAGLFEDAAKAATAANLEERAEFYQTVHRKIKRY